MSNYTIREEIVNGYTVRLEPDMDASSPLEDDFILGTITAWNRGGGYGQHEIPGHERLDIRDMTPEDLAEIVAEYDYALPIVQSSYNGFAAEQPSADGWNRSLGMITVSKERAQEVLGTTDITAIYSALFGDVGTLAQWAAGEVYGYVIEDHSGEVIESVWGYYGDDEAWAEALRSVPDAPDTSLTDREAIEAIRELSKGFPSALAHLKIIDILSRTNI